MKSDLLVRTNILMPPDPAKVIMRFFSPVLKTVSQRSLQGLLHLRIRP